jgi:hypothetical protein
VFEGLEVAEYGVESSGALDKEKQVGEEIRVSEQGLGVRR